VAWIMYVMQFKGNMHDANFFIVPFERIVKCVNFFFIYSANKLFTTHNNRVPKT
jgi:hypothetical protein